MPPSPWTVATGVVSSGGVAISCGHRLLRAPSSAPRTARSACIFNKPTRAGATYAQMTPDTFLARLCALAPARRPHRSILRCPRGAYCAPASFLGPTSPRDPSCSPCSFLTGLTGLSSFPPSPPCSSLSCAPRHPIASRGCRSSLAYSAPTSPSAPAVPDPCASPGPSPLPSKSPPSSMVLGRRRGPSLPDSSSCSRPADEPCDQLHRALTPGALVSYVRGPPRPHSCARIRATSPPDRPPDQPAHLQHRAHSPRDSPRAPPATRLSV